MKNPNRKLPKQNKGQQNSLKKKAPPDHKPLSAGSEKKILKPGSVPSFSKILVHFFFLILSLILFVYFSIGNNKSWFNDKIMGYWDEFNDQKDQLDLEYRKSMRLGKNYTNSRTIAENLKAVNGGFNNVLLLMPPTDYLKSKGLEYRVPEPSIFYYYTGVKTVWSNSKEVMRANWLFDFNNGRMLLTKIKDTNQLKNYLTALNKYKPSL